MILDRPAQVHEGERRACVIAACPAVVALPRRVEDEVGAQVRREVVSEALRAVRALRVRVVVPRDDAHPLGRKTEIALQEVADQDELSFEREVRTSPVMTTWSTPSRRISRAFAARTACASCGWRGAGSGG